MRRRFAYLHVPKAAGSSVTDAVRRAIAASDTEPAPSVAPWAMDRTLFGGFDAIGAMRNQAMVHVGPRDELALHDVVIGHYARSSLLAGRDDADVATVLREPRARLLSLFTFWRGWADEEHAGWDPYAASRRAASSSWQCFLADEHLAAQTDNVAARLLLHPHPLVPADAFVAEDDQGQVLAEALDALGRLGFVDVVERGADCWQALGDWLDTSLDVGRRNTTGDAVRLDAADLDDPEAVSLLGQRTAIDRVLWLAAAVRAAPTTTADVHATRAEQAAAAQVAKVTAPAAKQRRLGSRLRAAVRRG